MNVIDKAHLRVARPTNDLPEIVRFYRDGLGLEIIGSFEDHDGFDGIMLGRAGLSYHLEFTHHRGNQRDKAPSEENLLVFYLPESDDWQRAVDRMTANGYQPVKSHNPYWDVRGKTFEDADGYRLVLQQAAWRLPDNTTNEIRSDLQNSYDRVAEDYAERFRDELSKKPFDRKMLDWLAEKVGGSGVICDMGCGPGQVAGYLHDHGIEACGVDLSPEMIRQARALNPEISFQQGDMLALTDVAADYYGGIAAFYSIVNMARPAVVQALRELQRVLRPGGVLLLAFHIGREVNHLDEWWGKEVSLDFFFFETGEVKDYLTTTGFVLEEAIERDSYPDVEYQSRRAYVFARKPKNW